jgi:hypothetical protein|tara:strand:- start:285 stop:566 length:282 start_codon:yes stop_codon:yes gene_type:complete
MDNKYLNKVVDQLVSETKLDYDNYMVLYPFSPPLSFHNSFHFLSLSSPYLSSFSSLLLFDFVNHCKDVYGLNDEEVNYVWDRYREIIKVMSPL